MKIVYKTVPLLEYDYFWGIPYQKRLHKDIDNLDREAITKLKAKRNLSQKNRREFYNAMAACHSRVADAAMTMSNVRVEVIDMENTVL